MGYTHYMRQRGDLSDGWAAFCDDVRMVITECARGDIKIAGGDGTGAPEITPERVLFNGSVDQVIDVVTGATGMHESACFRRRHESGGSWMSTEDGEFVDFCKTARKPYDSVVVAVYALAAARWPAELTMKSDGRTDEWAAGIDLAQRAVGRAVPIPATIAQAR